MQVKFVTVDVFTDRQFGGNPLAVVPDATGLSTQQMQAIASEFNLAETTYVSSHRLRTFGRTSLRPKPDLHGCSCCTHLTASGFPEDQQIVTIRSNSNFTGGNPGSHRRR